MRALSLIGLLLALAMAFALVKREMRAGLATAPAPAPTPALTSAAQSLPPGALFSGPASASRDMHGQSQLIQQQMRQAVEDATLHPMQNAPEDAQ